MKYPHFIKFLLNFIGDYAWNTLLLFFGAAFYIVSAATVGMQVPMFVDLALLLAFGGFITCVQYISSGINSLLERKHGPLSTTPIDHHPSA